jgi:flagellar protein FlgJ
MKIQNQFPIKPPDAETRAAQQDAQLRQAAKMYESHFLGEMVKAMRSTIHNEDGLMKPNMAEKIFTEQLDQQYVENWSDKGGVGLADMIYNQIREKYMATTKRDFGKPPGPLPVAPKKELNQLGPADSLQMKALPTSKSNELSYRFEVQDPSGGLFEARAPMPGKVLESKSLQDGWNMVRLDHGRGLTSELTFPGSRAETVAGNVVQPGQRLGVLDPGRPVLAWKLDFT